ncbi:O-methyltransferase [Lacihabitans soyangensis]|uniref:Class I SAM-dependent methyltransferase n=1 Tax=Lacihabitans soyangensis TaxID=869394 RepID=A0AAE3H6Q9_9BACT|nr:class I SAM-dependent methyltransferase [Lacihabitans soyangensis]MCP9765089.1 class I SAM-dependent methyltransferase [Lacihabitans soyangensis]
MYLDFVKYFFQANNAHSIHSPFVFEFYNKVFKDKSPIPISRLIESERLRLISNKNILERLDFGAGTKRNTPQKISAIAKTSLKSQRWSQFLYRLVKFYNYASIIELGTSFGITTAYLAKANRDAEVYTFEGCPETLKIAKETFQNLEIQNVTAVQGNLDITLGETLSKVKKIDLAFFDANHREEPTLRYFEACLQLKTEHSCFVFDDIYWSDEMKNAWKTIINHPEVSISIDLFFVGLVFFRKGIEKQHFLLK